MQRTYFAIDLKSYYASAECAARHLDPLTTNLVVADSSRTEKTTCLAVSPSLKAYGIPGRARLFEVVQKVKEVNANRLRERRLWRVEDHLRLRVWRLCSLVFHGILQKYPELSPPLPIHTPQP